MKTLWSYIRWFFWWLVCAFAPPAKDLQTWLARSERTRPPWWEFKPCVWHNDAGKQWEVWFENENCFCKPNETLSVDLYIGLDTGRIVGLTVADEALEKH